MYFIVLAGSPAQCVWCDIMIKLYNEVIKEILKVDSTIKYFPKPIMDSELHKYPAKLAEFFKLWKPIVLLVSEQSWNDGSFKEVVVMNGLLKEDKYEWSLKWDPRVAANFGLWISEAIDQLITGKKIKGKKSSMMLNCTETLNLVSYF